MRNKKYILLFISLLFFITNVKADNLNLDEIITNNLEKETITYVEITSLDNIDKLNLYPNINKILIKNIKIDDISFINDLTNLKEISIYYSRINLKKFNNINVEKVEIVSSYILRDDLSSLKNSNIYYLDLEGSYITSIETVKYLTNLKELYLSTISNLKSLKPILNLDKLEKLDFGGSEELITNEILEFIKNKNITGTLYSEKDYIYLNDDYNAKLDDIVKNLNLENLTDIEKIKKITLYVVDNISYDDDCNTKKGCSFKEISFNRVAKSLSGKGVCYHYAILTNKLLNKAGIKSYLVGGYTKKGLAHEWVNVYLNDNWYAIDTTWIDTYSGESNKLKKNGTSKFFMVLLNEDTTYYNEHIADVYVEDIIDVTDKPITIDELEPQIKEENNIYKHIFIVFIIIIIIFIIYYIYYFAIKKQRIFKD